MIALTPFQRHVAAWKDCRRCPLCETRLNVVLCRGKVPADVLLVGEAPGEVENVFATPFVGPAGKLLDSIVARAVPSNLRVAFTNLVACIPRDTETGGKTVEPDQESIDQCKPRVQELIKICNPKVVVAVGTLAKDYLTPGFKVTIKTDKAYPVVSIVHPAFILRQNVAAQGMHVQRCIVTIENAIEEYCHAAG